MLEMLKKVLINFRDERNWKKHHNPKDLAISIVIEASELLEIFQWIPEKDLDNITRERKEEIEEEIADIMIYLIFLSDVVKIDIGNAVIKKMEKNLKRFPI